MNGVDLSDKDSAKYSTSLRTNRWYLRIFFWLIDRVVHACFLIAVFLASDTYLPEWKVYKSKHNGRKKFQTHLGIALINKGIELDWEAPYEEETKPKWMPQTFKTGKYQPCDCGICFFCKNGKTNTIAHGKVNAKPAIFQCSGVFVDMSSIAACCVCKSNAHDQYPGLSRDDLRAIKVIRNGKKSSILTPSRKGCTTCNLWVCPHHQPTFDHNPENWK